MKKSIILVYAFTAIVSCKSGNQKKRIAKANLVEAKQDLKETEVTVAMDFKEFKKEAKEKILSNAQRIAELRTKMDKPGSTFDGIYRNRIEKLEAKNAELKSKLNTYNGDDNEWKTFKSNFDIDMTEISNNIKDLFR